MIVQSVAEILAALPAVDREALMLALDAGTARYCVYAPGEFIGVHTDAVPHLKCVRKAGPWRAGTLKAKRRRRK